MRRNTLYQTTLSCHLDDMTCQLHTVGDLINRSDLVLRPNGLSDWQITNQTEVQIRTQSDQTLRPD